MKYLVRQTKKTYLERKKTVPNQTDNTCLVWKALNALSKHFSCKQNIPSTLTAEVFNDNFLSLAKTLTKTLQRGDEEYQCSDELKKFCTKRLKFDD